MPQRLQSYTKIVNFKDLYISKILRFLQTNNIVIRCIKIFLSDKTPLLSHIPNKHLCIPESQNYKNIYFNYLNIYFNIIIIKNQKKINTLFMLKFKILFKTLNLKIV